VLVLEVKTLNVDFRNEISTGRPVILAFIALRLTTSFDRKKLLARDWGEEIR